MIAQIAPSGSPASAPNTMYRNGRAVMMEPPGAPGEATIAMPSVMMNGMTVARLIGSWFIRQTAVAHAVSFCTLQIDRDRCSRGLCSKSCSITRNLVFYKGQRVFPADRTCDRELDKNADQMHCDNNKENFPEDSKDRESFADFA